jgi:enoyl-CoA hydratase
MGSPIIFERRDHTAIIRLNGSEKRNALSREMIVGLSDALKSIKGEPGIRAVILTGADDEVFCAGIEIPELTGVDENRVGEISERCQALCSQIENCPVPVIVAVNGVAAGGGCELALACHIRIAAPNASFSLPETKLGIIAGYGGTQRLAREIGQGLALEIMLTGRSVSAEEALRIGLINRIAPAGDLLTQAELVAREISNLAPLAIRACLEAVTCGLGLPLAEGLALESQLFSSLFATNDMREGTQAFLEKRRPVFKGN